MGGRPTDAELRARLTPEQYRVTQERGTEWASTGEHYHNARTGKYLCVVCGENLFSSAAKYDSGSGWPSFWQPVAAKSVAEGSDRSHGMTRTEVRCAICGAHLGHVFEGAAAKRPALLRQFRGARFQARVRLLMPRAHAWLVAASGVLIVAVASAQAPVPQTTPAQPVPAAVVLVTDLVKGVGNEALHGMTVIVHYTGWLYDPTAPDLRGRKFDSSRERGQPFSFPLGGGRVIRGWEQGVPGMKIGGLRQLVIPPALAYGGRSVGNGAIPPNSTLLFEIELLAVETVTFHPQQ